MTEPYDSPLEPRPGARHARRKDDGTFRSLRVPNYRRFFTGMAVSNVGTWMQRVAQDWLVLQLSDNDAIALGITTALQFAPVVLLSPTGGLLADRYSKRGLLFVTNAFLGLVALVLGVLVLSDVAAVWQVYLLASMLGVGAALDAPSMRRRATRSWSRWSAGPTCPTPSGSTAPRSTGHASSGRPWRAC
jgi:MFS family permease